MEHVCPAHKVVSHALGYQQPAHNVHSRVTETWRRTNVCAELVILITMCKCASNVITHAEVVHHWTVVWLATVEWKEWLQKEHIVHVRRDFMMMELWPSASNVTTRVKNAQEQQHNALLAHKHEILMNRITNALVRMVFLTRKFQLVRRVFIIAMNASTPMNAQVA